MKFTANNEGFVQAFTFVINEPAKQVSTHTVGQVSLTVYVAFRRRLLCFVGTVSQHNARFMSPSFVQG